MRIAEFSPSVNVIPTWLHHQSSPKISFQRGPIFDIYYMGFLHHLGLKEFNKIPRSLEAFRTFKGPVVVLITFFWFPGPSSEQIQKIREAISKASSLEEVERLNRLLQAGQIPSNSKSKLTYFFCLIFFL